MTDMLQPKKKPCNECPWRRCHPQGWTGPYTAAQWLQVVQSDHAIACHQTIGNNDQDKSELRQCAGAAVFRSNILKLPQDHTVATLPADRVKVFSTPDEFLEHHSVDGPMAKFIKDQVDRDPRAP